MSQNILEYGKLAFAGIAGAFFSFVGGDDVWINTLIIFVCLDVLTGLYKSILLKSEKSVSGGLNSTAMFAGGIRKALIFVVIGVAHRLDLTLDVGLQLRMMAVAYYIATEGISVLENAGQCGLPLPEKLIDVLEKVKESKGKEESEVID